jgi:hypothetical protein
MNYFPVAINNLEIIQRKVLELVPDNRKYNSSLFYIDSHYSKFLEIQELKEELIKLNMLKYVHSFAIYNLLPTTIQGSDIHIDYGQGTYSFNIPIANCENTVVNFYESSSDPVLKQTKDGNYYYHVDKNYCKIVDTLEMKLPNIINVKKIHNVSNYNPTTRITLLIRLTPEFTHEECLIRSQLNSQDSSSFS